MTLCSGPGAHQDLNNVLLAMVGELAELFRDLLNCMDTACPLLGFRQFSYGPLYSGVSPTHLSSSASRS
jgi:hypothetical protein